MAKIAKTKLNYKKPRGCGVVDNYLIVFGVVILLGVGRGVIGFLSWVVGKFFRAGTMGPVYP